MTCVKNFSKGSKLIMWFGKIKIISNKATCVYSEEIKHLPK
jgi:hypothetical protein